MVGNTSNTLVTGVESRIFLGPHKSIIEYTGAREGFPTRGQVTESTMEEFTWVIGQLAPGEVAELQFHAEALAPGHDIVRVGVFADQLPGPFGKEELTAIASPAGTISSPHIMADDGVITAGGLFDGSHDVFSIGSGSVGRESELAYQIIITNSGTRPMTNIIVDDIVGARTEITALNSIRAGYPTRGSITDTFSDGFIWQIGLLSPNESAEIQFFIEAVDAGYDSSFITVATDEVEFDWVIEDLISIGN